MPKFSWATENVKSYFQFYITIPILFYRVSNNKGKGKPLTSILMLRGKNLMFWDGDFLQSLNGFLDLRNGFPMEVCLAPMADSQVPCGQGELATFLPVSFSWISPPLPLENEDGEENRNSWSFLIPYSHLKENSHTDGKAFPRQNAPETIFNTLELVKFLLHVWHTMPDFSTS